MAHRRPSSASAGHHLLCPLDLILGLSLRWWYGDALLAGGSGLHALPSRPADAPTPSMEMPLQS